MRPEEEEEAMLERIAEKAAEKAAEKVCQRAADIAVKKIDAKYGPQTDTCKKDIKGLRKQVKDLQADIASRAETTAEVASEGWSKQAWLGGFPPMEKTAIEAKAKEMIGIVPGLLNVHAKAVSTGVVVEFDTAEHMKTYVSDHAKNIPAPFYLRRNRRPKSKEEQEVCEKVTDAWNSLVSAGIQKEQLRANPRKGIIWTIDGNGLATTAATVEHLEITWGPGAPHSLGQ